MEVVKKGEPGYDIEKDRRNSTFKIDEEGVAFMRNRKSLGWGELIFGILFIALGIYSFIRPSAALTGVTLFYGILALITGVVDIAFYVKMEQRTGFGPVLSSSAGF